MCYRNRGFLKAQKTNPNNPLQIFLECSLFKKQSRSDRIMSLMGTASLTRTKNSGCDWFFANSRNKANNGTDVHIYRERQMEDLQDFL